MRYKVTTADKTAGALRDDVEPVVSGLGFVLVELDLYRTKKSARVRLVAAPAPPLTAIGTEDLARLHRAVLPRLELALGGDSSGEKPGAADIYVEVSSPGLDRLIRDGEEFRCYPGRRIRCYLTGASDWLRGTLRGSDGEKILLSTEEGTVEVTYEHIAKARLDG
jgi:ribosome maturation factor RimP